MNIMFVSHTYIGGPFVVGSHHLARELSGMGHRVLHLSTSITPAHLLKMKEKPIFDRFKQWWNMRKMEGEFIHGVTLSLVPWTIAGRVYKKTGSNWFVESIRFPNVSRLLKRHRFSDVDLLLIDQPYFVGIEKYIRAKVVIYRPTDHYAEMSGDQTVALAEREIVNKAHGMVATSEPVLRNVQKYKMDVPAIVMENGVEFEHFSRGGSEPEELKSIPRPRAIYVGAVDERLDLEALRYLAERRPDISVIVIGPCPPAVSEPFSSLGNAFFLGQRPYAELPSYLHHADLALLPLSDHKANQGRSPMKLYEYAAAGLPIVVRETPELIRRGEDFLAFYNDHEELVEKVGRVLDRCSRKEISREAIRRAASKQSWKSKAEQIVEFSRRLRQGADAKKTKGVVEK
ncbi:glycosyltransferase [Cohnella sp. CFH 77786]|uniref:glycosyltransferase n=1 Tax=Cohnella sp. CFH 77786 TaxID=2662265 RepID=UPI001C60ECDE|nr:glycosyltransferase [Cohnella sp. CFH 77786]MBW5448385.1 glycosyltransferase [Cohnella sp. CFH 77786]